MIVLYRYYQQCISLAVVLLCAGSLRIHVFIGFPLTYGGVYKGHGGRGQPLYLVTATPDWSRVKRSRRSTPSLVE